jgi:sugar phosphate isomerase/epimerase
MINFDVGHYVGSLGKHPNEIIEKYHDRIIAIQIKDKTGPDTNPPNTNLPYGQGDTPLEDILLLIKKNKWPIIVDIELEHKIPEDSNAVMEVKKCMEYVKEILVA